MLFTDECIEILNKGTSGVRALLGDNDYPYAVPISYVYCNSNLGLEPFDKNLSVGYLESKFGGRKKPIKECLLDQSVVAGMGNIYSDEILFRAKIRPANSLNGCEGERLSAVIPECMAFFIEKNAITPEEYLETKGRDYRNTPFLQVYGHDGEACPVCGEMLCRTVIGGRSSVYCPDCQGNL